MKKFIPFVLLLLLSSVVVSSCVDKKKVYLDKLKKVVVYAEKNKDKLSDSQWEKLEENYNNIIDEIENLDYTSSQKKRISELKGRFTLALYTYKVKHGIDVGKDMYDKIKGLIDGVKEELKGF